MIPKTGSEILKEEMERSDMRDMLAEWRANHNRCPKCGAYLREYSELQTPNKIINVDEIVDQIRNGVTDFEEDKDYDKWIIIKPDKTILVVSDEVIKKNNF